MAAQERLFRLERILLDEARVRVRQVHAEKVELLPHAADHAHSLAEIHLGMPRRMRPRHERLTALRPADPHVIPDHRVAAGKALLVAPPLKDPIGRMPLLDRSSPVRPEDRVNSRQHRTQLRLQDRQRPRVAGRQRKSAYLLDGFPAQTEYLCSLTTAATLQE